MKKLGSLLLLFAGMTAFANTSISLGGHWLVSLDEKSDSWSMCPVPGIAAQAEPGLLPEMHHFASDVTYDCVWYKKTFDLESDARKAFLLLRAKYGATVWLNGKEVGASKACTYSHVRFDLTDVICFKGSNELVVRVGSWREASFPSKENKSEWWRTSRCPGIIDDVLIELCGSVVCDKLEVLPDVAAGSILVRGNLGNCAETPLRLRPVVTVRDAMGRKIIRRRLKRIDMATGGKNQFSVKLEAGKLKKWTVAPDESPVLYRIDLSCGKDLFKSIRFGYRDVAVRGKNVLLNGEKVHFAAENIAFTRALTGWADYVLDPVWVRNFIRTVKHEYGFNYLRMHLGHAPSFWYDIADEEGLMIQDEWCFMHEKDPEGDALRQTDEEFTLWVSENINHPSIIGWDMENEGDVSLTELSSRLREYDPTRMWPEDDFDSQHRYEYSENVVPVPFCEPCPDRPTTVLESCRLWINPSGTLEPKESFKTSRTAGSWGVYYYDSDILEQLQADIHADQGTYFRSKEIQAWAPFALLSGIINGHDFFRGEIGDSLVPQKNLHVLKSLNNRFGASFLMLQAHEWYRERVSYEPGSVISKPIVLWNDYNREIAVNVKIHITDSNGTVLSSDCFKTALPAFKSVTLEKAFSIPLPQDPGEYFLNVEVEDGTSVFPGPQRRIAVGMRPRDLSIPFDGAVCILDHFLPGISAKQKERIIETTFHNSIDSITDEGRTVNYTSYDSSGSKTWRLRFNHDGIVVSKVLIKDRASGWLQHAF